MTTDIPLTDTIFWSRWPEIEIPPASLPQFLLTAALAASGDRAAYGAITAGGVVTSPGCRTPAAPAACPQA